MGNTLRPLKRSVQPKKQKPDKLVAGFDIETDGLGGDFIAGEIWTSDNDGLFSTDLSELFEWILNHDQYIYLSHNGCGYEFAYLAPLVYHYVTSRDDWEFCPTVQGDSRFVQFRLTQYDTEKLTRSGKPTKIKEIDMRDTLCLWPMPLEKVADTFCPEFPKLKGAINFEKETFDPGNEDHRRYLHRDCEVLVVAYQRYRENVKTVFGSSLGVTAGSTAMRAFQANIEPGKAYFRDRKSSNIVRQAYYGGLVLPGHQVGEWGQIGCVDVNAAYGFQMKTHLFPVGSSYLTRKMREDRIGFFEVNCIVPESVFDTYGFNPIPRKDRDGLCWPTGEFTTFISTPEIIFARELGCTVDVVAGYEWKRQEDVFSTFMSLCEEWEVKENGRYKQSVKPQRNSLYGKFGSKPVHKVLSFSKDWQVGCMPVINEKTGEWIPGLWTKEEQLDAEYMLPEWAALICAYERLYLMKFIMEAYRRGAKNVYTDTDSLKFDLPVLEEILTENILPIGDRYGQFKLEEICHSFLLVGGKCFYGLVNPDLSNPFSLIDWKNGKKDLKKAKGVPGRLLDRQDYVDTLDNLRYNNKVIDIRTSKRFVSVKSVKSIFQEMSYVKPVERKRKLTNIKNSYSWQYTPDGKIWPRGYDILAKYGPIELLEAVGD